MKILNITGIGRTLLFIMACLTFSAIVNPALLLVRESQKLKGEIDAKSFINFLTATAFVALFFYIFFCQQRKIKLLQKQYHQFFDRYPTPMGIVEVRTQKFLAVNKAALNCYGYTAAEFLSMTVNDMKSDDGHTAAEINLETVNFGLRNKGTRKYKKKNGDTVLTEVLSGDLIFKNKKCRLILTNDITEIIKAREEKKIAEDEKKQQEHFTSFVLENFPVDVAVFDPNHRYIFLNKTAVKNDEMRNWMIGKDDFEYFKYKGKDSSIAEKRRELFLRAIDGENTEWIDEHIVDQKEKFILRKFYPYRENGQLKYVFGYGTDITEIKKAEFQRDEHIAQLEKIAFNTSHGIRQPICNLQGLIALIEMEKIENPDLKTIIDYMEVSINKLDNFTRELAVKLTEYKDNLSSAKTGN